MEYRSPISNFDRPVALWLRRFDEVDPQVLYSLRKRFRLSPTQARVATLLADRLTNAEIACELRVKPSTARRHTEAVLLRLGVDSRFKVVTRLTDFLATGGRL